MNEFVRRYSNYLDRTSLFDSIVPTISRFYEEISHEEQINEDDLDVLSDASDLSEDEEDINQRELWVESHQLLREEERKKNEERFNIENETRQNCIAANQEMDKY